MTCALHRQEQRKVRQMKKLFDDPKKIERVLKVIIIGMGIFGALFYAAFLPEFIRDLISRAPDFSGWFWPWMILIWLTAVPCYIVLVLAWRSAVDAGKKNSFTMKNAERLQKTGRLASGDGIFFLIMNLIYWLIGLNHPGILLASCLIFFICIAFAVVVNALAVMVARAAELEEESKFTI